MSSIPLKHLKQEQIARLVNSISNDDLVSALDAIGPEGMQEVECLALFGKSETPQLGYEWHADHITMGGYHVPEWTAHDVKRGAERLGIALK